MTGEPWTDEQKKLVTELWTEGLSASQIAGRFKGRSRNAVIGVIHRGGLQNGVRAIPAKPKTEPRDQARVFGETRVRPAVVFGATGSTGTKPPFTGVKRTEAFLPLPDTAPIPWTARLAAQCAWPVDVDGAEEQHSCAAPCGEATYCAKHLWWRKDKIRPTAKANELERSVRRYANA